MIDWWYCLYTHSTFCLCIVCFYIMYYFVCCLIVVYTTLPCLCCLKIWVFTTNVYYSGICLLCTIFWQCACVLALACGGNVGSHRVNTASLIPSYLYTFSSTRIRSVLIKLSRLLHNVYYKQNNLFQKEIARAFKQIVKVVIKWARCLWKACLLSNIL